MDIRVAALADNAILDRDSGKLSIIGAFDRILVREFPVPTHPWVIVLVADVNMRDIGEHRLSLDLARGLEDSRRLAEGLLNVARVAWRGVANIVIPVGPLDIDSPGEYTFEVLIDDRHMATIPLTVAQRADGEES